MKVYVVTYAAATADDGPGDVLCVKYDGSTPAIYANASDANNRAEHLQRDFPTITYTVTEVTL